MASIKPVIFSICIVSLIVIGIVVVIRNYEENKCEMTWMFEQPQYLVGVEGLKVHNAGLNDY